MANEEMEKTMQSILDQQAKVTVKLEIVSEKIEVLGEKIDRLTEDVTALKEVTHTHSQTLEHMVIALEKLIKAQARTDQKLATLAKRTDQKFAELAQAQARTDQQLGETDKRLGSLIKTVDRYIRNGRNGKK